MAQQLNQSLRPPGGYYFIDSDKVKHEGASENNLAANLARYRIGLGRPPGNPLAEVVAQICQRYPTHCTGEPDKSDAESLDYDAKHFATIVASGIRSDVISQAQRPLLAFVDSAVAAARLAICATCPGRVRWTDGCAPCQKSVAGLAEQTVSPSKLQPDSEALACLADARCLGIEANRAKPRLVNHPDVPAKCWRKATA